MYKATYYSERWMTNKDVMIASLLHGDNDVINLERGNTKDGCNYVVVSYNVQSDEVPIEKRNETVINYLNKNQYV